MTEALYVDASAAIKRYFEEPGAAESVAAQDTASKLISSVILNVEVGAALLRAADDDETLLRADEQWSSDWRAFEGVGLSRAVADHAISLAAYHGLGALDAIHLASALAVPAVPMRFATWDRKLWDAAQAVGIRRVPAERP